MAVKKYIGEEKKNIAELIDVERGLFVGEGVDMAGFDHQIVPVYIPWGTLNSHFQVFGTTRQGKSRLLAFVMRQIIEKGDDVFLIEPKGSEGQELLSWALQYASEFERERDLFYLSPAFGQNTFKLNPIYGMGNEEISGTVENMIEADEQFYTDIANEIIISTLLSLEFLERCLDPLVVEMMLLTEQMNAAYIDPLTRLNRAVYEEEFSSYRHGVNFQVSQYMMDRYPGDEKWARRVMDAKKLVEQYYIPGSEELPLRSFVTFRDLAPFANIDEVTKLQIKVKEKLEEAKAIMFKAESDGEPTHITHDVINIGQEALREISKVATRDKNYFSKVSSTYATTMTKLSSGDVGRMLCDCRINPLRDRLYDKERGAIVVMQPFPLKYDAVANTVVKIMLSMFSSIMGAVGESGNMTSRRIHVMVDEAGAVVSRQVAENLANKGGGLGLSLHLYSQSMSDYVNKLEREGAAILSDNMNTKGFFRVNANDSAEEMSAIIGTKKMGAATYTSSDNREGRSQSRTAEELIVPPHILQRLPAQTWVLKTDNSIYMMESPWQDDPFVAVDMPSENVSKRVQDGKVELEHVKESF